jgi:drug/metabolite transporter (DMT)-like permease
VRWQIIAMTLGFVCASVGTGEVFLGQTPTVRTAGIIAIAVGVALVGLAVWRSPVIGQRRLLTYPPVVRTAGFLAMMVSLAILLLLNLDT